MEKPTEEEVYEIENIASGEGCIVSLIKYVTLFIIGFILLWILTLSIFGELGFEYSRLIGFMISIGLTGYFLYRVFNHSDKVYKLIFDDKKQDLTIISGNTFDGIDTELKIQYDSLFITIEKRPLISSKVQLNKSTQFRDDKLSQDRILKIFDSNKLKREVSIDLSSWCRHEKIDTILDKLIEISNKK